MTRFFFAISPRWLAGDITYKIYVREKCFCGARIAGQFFDPEYFAQLTSFLSGFMSIFISPFLRRSVDKAIKRIEDTDSYYDSLDPMSEEFLGAHMHNFRISSAEINRVVIRNRHSWWTANYPNTGVIRFEFKNGKSRRFILIGEQDNRRITSLIQEVASETVVLT